MRIVKRIEADIMFARVEQRAGNRFATCTVAVTSWRFTPKKGKTPAASVRALVNGV